MKLSKAKPIMKTCEWCFLNMKWIILKSLLSQFFIPTPSAFSVSMPLYPTTDSLRFSCKSTTSVFNLHISHSFHSLITVFCISSVFVNLHSSLSYHRSITSSMLSISTPLYAPIDPSRFYMYV